MAKRKSAVDSRILSLLERLTGAYGPSSFEGDVRDIFRQEVKGFADKVWTCGLGSIIAQKSGGAKQPRIMIAGHMDEVGFMVRGITSKGYIKFNPIGGWWGHVVLGQKVVIRTRNGKDVIGVIGSKAPHILSSDERKKVMDLDKMFIDVGSYGDYNAPEKLGIRVGDPIVPLSGFHILGDGKMLMAKAWDDRIGVAAAIEVLRRLKGVRHPNTVFAVGTTQEEVGLRGAGTSAYEVNPDIGFAIDVTIACDTPGSNDADFAEKCGKGPSISVMDGSLLPNKTLLDFVIDTAEEEKIPYQLSGVSGATPTDANVIQVTREGVATALISIPTRYLHTPGEVLSLKDVEGAIKLISAFVRRVEPKMSFIPE